jgi:glutamine amidotransferase
MRPKTIAVIDYGMGNLQSIQNAIEHVGGHAVVIDNPDKLKAHSKIILPGVGAFAQAIECLNRTGLASAIDERRKAGAQILGICLGMQLMCSVSEEDGEHIGLGWFQARVVPFIPQTGLSVPHMGWNAVDIRRNDKILGGLASGSDAYFVHSFHMRCDNDSDVIATTEYGTEFHSVVQRENLRGIQFHPEKSQEFGLAIICNFLEMAC